MVYRSGDNLALGFVLELVSSDLLAQCPLFPLTDPFKKLAPGENLWEFQLTLNDGRDTRYA